MGRKKTEDAIREANCGRVKLLLEQLWRNNQSRMAGDLGVTQSLISKIVRGSQGPGRELLEKLAQQPDVRAEWVLRGEGTPLVPPTHGTLPVACGVLPGSPERCPELLSGERWPTAEAFIRPSRFWCRLEPTCPALKATELALLPGDMVLLDANPAVWADRLSESVGKMFGVRVRRGEQMSYQLALLRRDPLGLMFDAFTEHYRLVAPSPSKPPAPAKAKGVERLKRKVRSLKPVDEAELDEAMPPAAALTTPPRDVPFLRVADVGQPITITEGDIIAVRVGLFRA